MIKFLPVRVAPSKSGLRRAIAVLMALNMLALTACSTTEMAGLTPGAGSSPNQERIGEGKAIIGLLSVLEPNNLSDGAEDSIHLAAKLAITSLKEGLATLEIRPSGASDHAARQGASALAAARAKIVIAAGDQAVGTAAAKVLVTKGVPTIALATVSDTGTQLYGAGLGTRAEMGALMAELARLNYKRIAVARTADAASQVYAQAVLGAAAGANIVATAVDASPPTLFLSGLAEMIGVGKPDAVVFATGPARAEELAVALRSDTARDDIAIVGNAHWAMAEPLGKPLIGSWYPSLPRDGLASFVGRFKTAYGKTPTLNGVVVYDLIILAAALPQAVPDAPYAPEILRSDSGFDGFSGPFRIGAANLVEQREYGIVTAR